MDELKYKKVDDLTVGDDAKSLFNARADGDESVLNNAGEVIKTFVISKLTQKQFDALAVLVAFVGPNQFYHSLVRDRLNRCEYRAAAALFLLLDSHIGTYTALEDLAMRIAERALFLEGMK